MNVCWCLKGDVSEPRRLDPKALAGLFPVRVLLPSYKCASAVVFVQQVLDPKRFLLCKMRNVGIKRRLEGERGKEWTVVFKSNQPIRLQIFPHQLKEGMYKSVIVHFLNLVVDLRDLGHKFCSVSVK